MRHMGNSGKIGHRCVLSQRPGLLVLTAITLEEAVLVAFLGAVAVGYVASVAEAFARRRYLALLAGGVGTSLFIGCGIAFLRMWGLAFNQDPATPGPGHDHQRLGHLLLPCGGLRGADAAGAVLRGGLAGRQAAAPERTHAPHGHGRAPEHGPTTERGSGPRHRSTSPSCG